MQKEEVMRRNQMRHVQNEKRFLAAISHPFIINLEYYAKDQCHLYFVMPYAMGGDLFGMITDKGMLGELNAKFYSAQLVLAIEYLHYLDILYR